MTHHSSLNFASHLASVILEIMKAKCIVVICGPLLFSISFILAYYLPQLDYLSGLAFQTSDCLMVYQTRQPARNYVVWERIVRRIILLHVQNVLQVPWKQLNNYLAGVLEVSVNCIQTSSNSSCTTKPLRMAKMWVRLCRRI